eukprot:2790578-Rhodomonas_salina.5
MGTGVTRCAATTTAAVSMLPCRTLIMERRLKTGICRPRIPQNQTRATTFSGHLASGLRLLAQKGYRSARCICLKLQMHVEGQDCEGSVKGRVATTSFMPWRAVLR